MAKASAFCTLIEKPPSRIASRTIDSTSPLTATENNLGDWFVSLNITNTGISKTNSGTLTLRIDGLGTFIRTGPILVNEDTKNNFYIELQIKQDLDNDGDFSEDFEQGQVLRAIIGQPQITIDQSFGEVLTLQLTGIEYALKETLTSEWHIFQNPAESFSNRIGFDINGNPDNPVLFDNINITLPTNPRLSWKPSSPTTVHDQLADIINLLSNPDVTGGSFDDFYFDIIPSPTDTNFLTINAKLFGEDDSGVILDPLSIEVADTDEEQSVITDNIEYKNHVIMTGTATGGSLPMERTRFSSNWEHARIRDVWDTNISYIVGDLVKFKTVANFKPSLITYHECIEATTPADGDPFVTSGTKWKIDFTVYPPFITTSATFYRQGEIVTQLIGSTIEFYQCNTSGTFGTGLILSGSSVFDFLVSVEEDDYEEFVTYTPWTNDVDVWKDSLAGTTKAGNITPTPPNGQPVGWAVDWNITKANYNREDFNNHFETVSVKNVNDKLTAQPSTGATPTGRQNYDGQRFLLDDSPTGTEWSGNGDKIAEYDDSQANGSKWIFSNAPVDSDLVNDMKTAEILRYNGTSWVTLWDGTNQDHDDKPSPFHLCSNVGLVAGATGVSGQAVEFTYDWFVNPLDTDNTHYFRTSRGVWLSNSFPLPRLETANFAIGELWGGDGNNAPNQGALNTNNYDKTRKGILAWNRGIDDEDKGRISNFAFKMRVSMTRDPSGTSLVEGQPNIPMTFWTADKFDRIWFTKFKLERNGQWDTVKIPVGDLAPSTLYYGRWDELAKLNGVVITELDFTLDEKEFSGVKYDWREFKHWGVQLSEAYVETGLYKNGHQRAFEFGEDIMADLSANWYWYLLGPLGTTVKNLLPQHTPVTQNHIRLGAKITIDDLHFEKEQIVTSDDTPVQNNRTIFETIPQEGDYNNLKRRAIARQARKRFFPQIWHLRSTGDVRLKFGTRFKALGSRVPHQASDLTTNPPYDNGTNYNAGDTVSFIDNVWEAKRDTIGDQPDISPDDWENLNEMVVSQVKHMYNTDGYKVEIAGFRKWVFSG